MLSSRDIIRELEQDGWYHFKTAGDHWQFKHPSKPGKVTVPHPCKDLALKVISSIEKQSGLKLKK